MKLKHWLLIGSALLCATGLIGCSDETKQNLSPADKQEKGTVAQEQVTNPSSEDSELSVTITPEIATARTELRAISGGNPKNPDFRWQINGNSVDEKTNHLSADNFARGDVVSVTMTTDTTSITTTKEILNSPPRITGSQFVEPRLHAGVDVEIVAETEDADGDSVDISYTWSHNGEELFEVDGNRLPGENLKRGDRIAFTAIPNDGTIDGPTYIVNEFLVPNGAPRFVSTYPLEFSNFTYRYPAKAEDPDNDPLIYQLESGPEGMSIDPQSGELNWKIRTSQSGDYRVSITATDTEGLQATQEFTLAVTIPE